MRNALSLPVALAGALLVSGCAANYAFRPAENATAEVAGRAAADYAIPPLAPTGDVRVASFGVTKIQPVGSKVPIRALHVRYVIANDSGQPWTVATQNQLIALESMRAQPPSWIATNEGFVGTLPCLTVAARGKRTIDLFYSLPDDMQENPTLANFDVLWQVQTDKQLVAQRTPFEKTIVERRFAQGYGPQ